ncbi:MAG TPA: response regulator, partial [Kofleriaceae bacterium]|nr:response regulator [Kofleriaceae bacterium]
MNRGILLIDSDPTFRTALTVILQKYRIDVVHEPDADEAIALGATHKPSLIVVGVEEPDKLGFKTFQRIKKGPLSGVPIMMVTSSVSAESFAKHKGLKTHANEYVDKRTTSKEALAAKLDALIEFGPAEDDLDIPVEVSDDINLSGEQNVLDEEAPETEYASDQKTAMGGPEKKIDASVAEDVDDAFAGMMGGDEVPSLDEVRAKPRAA